MTEGALGARVADDREDLTFWPNQPLTCTVDRWPGMRIRWITEPDPDGWDDFVLSEWELERAGWADLHPHSETNLVIQGELHIECEGRVEILRPGDSASVGAGRLGRYWAPEYARMFVVYGPNPDGAESTYIDYWDIR